MHRLGRGSLGVPDRSQDLQNIGRSHLRDRDLADAGKGVTFETRKPVPPVPLVAPSGLLGMTPSEAIVAATRNGALASKALDEYGTLEAGKAADIVVLDADPLADISNIRRLSMVIKGGRVIDVDALPTNPIALDWAAGTLQGSR